MKTTNVRFLDVHQISTVFVLLFGLLGGAELLPPLHILRLCEGFVNQKWPLAPQCLLSSGFGAACLASGLTPRCWLPHVVPPAAPTLATWPIP